MLSEPIAASRREAVKLRPVARAAQSKPVIGWREWVELPELAEDAAIKVKVDTGARTSSLHAFNLKLSERDGQTYADFEVHPSQRSRRSSRAVSVPVSGFRRVRSSSGHSERRPVIRTPIRVGSREFVAEITLTSRDEMGFRMLLGRSSLRRFVVDPGRSYLQSTNPQRKVKS